MNATAMLFTTDIITKVYTGAECEALWAEELIMADTIKEARNE